MDGRFRQKTFTLAGGGQGGKSLPFDPDQNNSELGTTAVVITHNIAIAAMADRVIHLGNGRIQRIETNEHKLAPEALRW